MRISIQPKISKPIQIHSMPIRMDPEDLNADPEWIEIPGLGVSKQDIIAVNYQEKNNSLFVRVLLTPPSL
jgi:hypothetical protein